MLRHYDLDGDKAMRVLFRDDDNNKIHGTNVTANIIDYTVGEPLKNGVTIAGA